MPETDKTENKIKPHFLRYLTPMMDITCITPNTNVIPANPYTDPLRPSPAETDTGPTTSTLNKTTRIKNMVIAERQILNEFILMVG